MDPVAFSKASLLLFRSSWKSLRAFSNSACCFSSCLGMAPVSHRCRRWWKIQREKPTRTYEKSMETRKRCRKDCFQGSSLRCSRGLLEKPTDKFQGTWFSRTKTYGKHVEHRWEHNVLWHSMEHMYVLNLLSEKKHFGQYTLFPTCQVRVVRFYVSCLLLLLLLLLSSSSSSSSPPPPRPPRRPCSTATRDPQCSLPDLNHDHPRPVFPAGPQPRPSTPNVPCRTSTTTILAQCSLPETTMPSVPCRTSTARTPSVHNVGRYGTKNVQKKVRKNVRRYARRYGILCQKYAHDMSR